MRFLTSAAQGGRVRTTGGQGDGDDDTHNGQNPIIHGDDDDRGGPFSGCASVCDDSWGPIYRRLDNTLG